MRLYSVIKRANEIRVSSAPIDESFKRRNGRFSVRSAEADRRGALLQLMEQLDCGRRLMNRQQTTQEVSHV